MSQRFSAAGHWRQLLRQSRLEASEVLSSTAFLTLLAIGLIFVATFSFVVGSHDGLPSFPLTHLMVEAIGLGVRLTLVLILVLYAGELVYNSRALKLSEVYDALPVPNWVLLGAKIVVLLSITGLFFGVALSTTVLTQLARGFTAVDPVGYVKGMLILAWPLVPLIVLAVCLQVMANRKLLGLLLITVVLVLKFALPRLGFENNLLLFGDHPKISYSDLNGYGHHVEPFLWFMTYWSFGAVVLGAVALLFWPRGTEIPMRERLVVAGRRFSKPIAGAVTVGVLGMAGVGAWIYYNTTLRNEYLDRSRIIQRLAEYELAYADDYRHLPLPRVTSVYTEVDIYPGERRVDVSGRYRLENRGAEPIRVLPITRSPRWTEGVLRVYGGVSIEALELPDHRVLVADEELGFYAFELGQPLAVGESMELGFSVRVDHGGFVNRHHNYLVVENGTFFSGSNFLPTIGYARGNQLLNPTHRAKRSMAAAQRAAPLGDLSAQERNYLESDWIHFETILSTRADQIAVSVGDLEREWTDGDRRYFHYKTPKTSVPITNLLPFLSGSFEVTRDQWQGIDIEIYFDPDHRFNIDRFMDVTKKSLAYMTEHFGPYPHNQLRIVEIPNYHDKVAFAFAQVIAYSESWSFTSDLDGAELDWLAGVLAHEVSHQWWNHQVVPADVQGATMLGESLAQYSAMMILEEMYGSEAVRHYLKFHLDRYLERRGNESIREMPLALVEDQAYVHYSKASLVFYLLKDRVGEAVLNEALRAFLEETAFAGPPYPTSRDLIHHLRRAVPDDHHALIDDLFEAIVLFDNRVASATYVEQADGKFAVTLKTTSLKLRGDGVGNTTEVALDDWVDVGIFGQREIDGEMQETVLAMETRRLQSNENTFTWIVDERPVRAGIDPYNKLIDRDSGDNVRALTEVSQP